MVGAIAALSLFTMVYGVVTNPIVAPDVGSPASSARPPTSRPSLTSAAPLAPDVCNVSGLTLCALNPAVSQATIGSTICVSGWTATVRPPSTYTSQLKAEQLIEFKLPGRPRDYEEDHRLPLELGGAPSDVHNLSPESHATSYQKDGDENAYKLKVCSGSLSLAQAQSQFVAKWLGPYPSYKA